MRAAAFLGLAGAIKQPIAGLAPVAGGDVRAIKVCDSSDAMVAVAEVINTGTLRHDTDGEKHGKKGKTCREVKSKYDITLGMIPWIPEKIMRVYDFAQKD